MNSLTTYFEGMTSLLVGAGVGILTENITTKLEKHRADFGLDEKPDSSVLDTILDIFIETAFLVMSISFTEKAIPGITKNSSTLLLFHMGVVTQQKRLPTKVSDLFSKFSI